MRGVTHQGADALARWQAFRAYLRHIKPHTATPGAFSRLLPYAAALGSNISYLTRAYKETAEPLPNWYQPANVAATLGVSAATGLLLRDWSREWDGFSAVFVASSGSAGGGGSGGGGGGSVAVARDNAG